MNRLIVWYDRDNNILGAFGSIRAASQATGVSTYLIGRSLRGTYSRTKEGWHFHYEVKAQDLREKREKEKLRKELEKGEEWFKD